MRGIFGIEVVAVINVGHSNHHLNDRQIVPSTQVHCNKHEPMPESVEQAHNSSQARIKKSGIFLKTFVVLSRTTFAGDSLHILYHLSYVVYTSCTLNGSDRPRQNNRYLQKFQT